MQLTRTYVPREDMQFSFFLKIMFGLIITIPLHAHISQYIFEFRNIHNNKEIYSLTGPMACGIIAISESVMLLSSRVIYGMLVINKSIIHITHAWDFLISS